MHKFKKIKEGSRVPMETKVKVIFIIIVIIIHLLLLAQNGTNMAQRISGMKENPSQAGQQKYVGKAICIYYTISSN